MSTIVASSTTHSPLARLQTQLGQDVKAGTIKSTDEDALSSALTSIDSSLSSSRSGAPSSSTPPDPTEIASKISDLVDKQVSAGTLTTDQASELKQLFSDAAPKDGADSVGKVGHGHRGPPPPPPPDDGADAASATDGTSATGTTSSAQDSLNAFLKQLQASLAQGYGQDGSTTTGSSSLLLDVSA